MKYPFRTISQALLSLSMVYAVAGCAGHYDEFIMTEAPDYQESQMWYKAGAETVPETGKAPVDVFYILPTCVWDWTDSLGRTCHFADVRNPEHIAAMLPSNELAYDIFGKYADFYSPYYRQITLDSWTSDEIAEERFPYAMEDVYRAFDYYMEHWNDGRPFFLAGFSQGAKCVVELLKSLDEDEVNSTYLTDALNRQRITNIVNESGLYTLIFQSRKPEAKAFRKWVTSEVLPSIRKKGYYGMYKPKTDFIDARDIPYETRMFNNSPVRCVTIDNETWYSMNDLHAAMGSRTDLTLNKH